MTPHEPRLFQRAGVFVSNIPFKNMGDYKELIANRIIDSLYSIQEVEDGSISLVSSPGGDLLKFIVNSYTPSLKRQVKEKIESLFSKLITDKKGELENLKEEVKKFTEIPVKYQEEIDAAEKYISRYTYISKNFKDPEFLFETDIDKNYYATLGEGEKPERGWFMFTLFAGKYQQMQETLNHINKMITPTTEDGKPNRMYDPLLGIYSVVPMFGHLFVLADRTEAVYNKLTTTPHVYFEPHTRTGQILVTLDNKSDIIRFLGDKVKATEVAKNLGMVSNIVSGKGGKEATASMLEYIKENNNKVVTYVDVTLVPDFKTDKILYRKQELPMGTHKGSELVRNIKTLSNSIDKKAIMEYYLEHGKNLGIGDIVFNIKARTYSEIIDDLSTPESALKDPSKIKNRMIINDSIFDLGTFSSENGMLDSKKLSDIFEKSQSRLEEVLKRRSEQESEKELEKPQSKKQLKNLPSFLLEDTKKEGAVSEEKEKSLSPEEIKKYREQLSKITSEMNALYKEMLNASKAREFISTNIDNYKKSMFGSIDKYILDNLNKSIEPEVNEFISKYLNEHPESDTDIRSFGDYINKVSKSRNLTDDLTHQIYWMIQDKMDDEFFVKIKTNELEKQYAPAIEKINKAIEEKSKEHQFIMDKLRGPEKEKEVKIQEEKESKPEEKGPFEPHYDYEILMSSSKSLYGRAYSYLRPNEKPKVFIFNLSDSEVASPGIDILISAEGKKKILEYAQKILKENSSSFIPTLKPILKFYPESIKDFESADLNQSITIYGNLKVTQVSEIDKGAMEKRVQEPEEKETK